MFTRRQWGWFLTILSLRTVKVKILRLHRGRSISLQLHHDRAELWFLLRGMGALTLGEGGAGTGRVVLIPPKCVHKLLALTPMLVLEIQYGRRCVEDDIVRLSD